jgi:hypothetical protein
MKIGLLTLPLHTNYGGNLQAYALMKVLKDLGHEVILINRSARKKSIIRLPFAIVKRIISKYIFSRKNVVIFAEYKQRSQEKRGINSSIFLEKYIYPKTQIISTSKQLRSVIGQYKLEAIVVGSDQVWRPKYTANISDYFLEFVKDVNMKKISYAASFGVDEFEYSSHQQKIVRPLLEKFTNISTREDSGVSLVKDKFGLQASQVLDPTLLLHKDDYHDLIREHNLEVNCKGGGIFKYVLDETEDKDNAIKILASHLNVPVLDIGSVEGEWGKGLKPGVEIWLQKLCNADIVFSDSFHACVFSIIFNKPFIGYGNLDRGLTRFRSLLSLFSIEDRLITNSSQLSRNLIEQKIDWEEVNTIHARERDKSFKFLIDSL